MKFNAKSGTIPDRYIFTYRTINGSSNNIRSHIETDLLVREDTGHVNLNLRGLLINMYGSDAINTRFENSISLINDIFITITSSTRYGGSEGSGTYVSVINTADFVNDWVYFAIADDATFNDGDFYIKVELL
jgi:hypothetical protein